MYSKVAYTCVCIVDESKVVPAIKALPGCETAGDDGKPDDGLTYN